MLDLLYEFLLKKLDKRYLKNKKREKGFGKSYYLPSTLITISGIVLFILFKLFFYFKKDSNNIKATKNKIQNISILLEKEKRDLGKYPDSLNMIIRNDPLRKGITKDIWGNEFIYKKLNNDFYNVFSKGKDGITGTKDDVKTDGGASSWQN